MQKKRTEKTNWGMERTKTEKRKKQKGLHMSLSELRELQSQLLFASFAPVDHHQSRPPRFFCEKMEGSLIHAAVALLGNLQAKRCSLRS